jgi:mono/diheme cytochrome c family protein
VLLALTGYQTALLVVAASFIVFALIAALVVPRSRPSFPGNRLGIFLVVCVVFFAAQLTAVLVLAEIGEADEPAVAEETTTAGETTTETTATETTTTETTPAETTESTETTETTQAAGDPVAGKEVFLGTSGCSGCHTLADAGATGAVGPNLDAVKPSYDKVVTQVTNGGGGMPAFGDSLSEQQILDVAAYVSSATQS